MADFGDNASVSASGSNEITLTFPQLTNDLGADLSDAIIHIRGVGYWSQTYFDQNNFLFNYNTLGFWEATADDGSSMRMSSGRAIIARPKASICCSPPERYPATCLRRSLRRGKKS